jgi:hypothetical protein
MLTAAGTHNGTASGHASYGTIAAADQCACIGNCFTCTSSCYTKDDSAVNEAHSAWVVQSMQRISSLHGIATSAETKQQRRALLAPELEMINQISLM